MERLLRGFRLLRLGYRQTRELARIANQQQRNRTMGEMTVAPTNLLLERTNKIEERIRQLA
jgi:hypothetical protein